MAITQTKVECESCGASSFVAVGNSLLKCEYCGTASIVDGLEESPTHELRDTLARRTRKIETVLKKGASYMYDGVSDGGWLHVTKQELVFLPHRFNLNSGYRLVFPFAQMRDIRKHDAWLGLSKQLIVEMKDAEQATFLTWGRDATIACIEKQISQPVR
jgi:hypothetical protein